MVDGARQQDAARWRSVEVVKAVGGKGRAKVGGNQVSGIDVLQHRNDGGRLGQSCSAIRIKAHQRVRSRLR